MKVILASRAVYPFHSYGGMEKYVYFLAKYLTGLGVEVEIYTSRGRENKREAVYDGIKYRFIGPMVNRQKFKIIWSIPFTYNLGRELEKSEFDILHTFEMMGYFYLRKKNRKPVIVQPFAFEQFKDPETIRMRKNPLKRIYIDILLRYPLLHCLRNADKVALEGDFQNAIVDELSLDHAKTFVLPVGIDIPTIKEKLESVTLSREDLGLSDEDFVYITVNRLDPNKGMEYLIKAFSQVKEKQPNSRHVLIGGGIEEDRIRKMVREEGLEKDILMLKNISEEQLYGYYKFSDVYVSPTLQEDFMMSILEGMACGLPVVSTGQPFLVKSGVNGYVVRKRDPGDMAEKMLELSLSGRKSAMGEEARKTADYYDFRNIARIAKKTYEEMI